MKRTILYSVVFLSFIVGGCQSSPPSPASLHQAAEQGDATGVKTLLDQGADVNVADYWDNTPLMEAVKNGSTETVRLLLERGADVNAANSDGWTSLIWAAAKGNRETVRLLLDSGADVKARNSSGWTPLLSAAQRGSTETVRLLLERGADVNAANSDGLTSLMWAAWKGSWETVRLLLDSGADVKARNANGSTPLMEAAQQGNNETVRLLLDSGADINAANSDGWTSLMWAAWNGKKETAQLLLDRGAAPELDNHLGQSAADLAVKSPSLKRLLERAIAREQGQEPPPPTAARAKLQVTEEQEAQNRELAQWNRIKDSRQSRDYQIFLQAFPDGIFANIAKDRLDNLTLAAARTKELAKIERKLREESRKAAQADPYRDIDFGKYYALVIGNNRFKHLPDLGTAVNDARSVANVLGGTYGFKVNLLIDASRDSILNALDEYREGLSQRDNLLIYYAGHGRLDEDDGEGYWLPVDARKNRRSKWISTATITSTLKALDAKHVMVVADSCFSGTLVRGVKVRSNTPNYVLRMAAKKARVVLTSGGLEPVADDSGGGHSPFAKVFIDVLEANDGVLDGTRLFTLMRRPVMLLADQTPEYSDVRKAGHDGGDFLFVRRK